MEESLTAEIQEDVINLEEYLVSTEGEAYTIRGEGRAARAYRLNKDLVETEGRADRFSEQDSNVNENSESERAENSPSGNERQNEGVDREAELQDRVLASDIKKMLKSSEPLLSPKCCIYKVPHDLRKMNEEAYTPQFISIGHLHHGDERLETMEKLKVRYLNIFEKEAARNVDDLVSAIRGKEGDVRRCYSETSDLRSDDYVKMILLDAGFIIVFFLIFHLQKWKHYLEFEVFTERLVADMMLLENQLPFFVIEELYDLAFPSRSEYPSFTELTFEIFEDYNTQKISPDCSLEIKHFVDLLRTFFLPPSERLQKINRCDEVYTHLYTASQLDEAGVKFHVPKLKDSSKCLFDLKFTKGVLEIPHLDLYDSTESLFRNLMAFEQFHYRLNHYVIDYIRLLDFLIDTAKDVDLLVQKDIMFNGLGDSNAMTTMVNNLCKQIIVSKMNSDYFMLCDDLNKFYGQPQHKWKVNLRSDYFSITWKTASTIAAFILLVLTFIQTVYSIISLL